MLTRPPLVVRQGQRIGLRLSRGWLVSRLSVKVERLAGNWPASRVHVRTGWGRGVVVPTVITKADTVVEPGVRDAVVGDDAAVELMVSVISSVVIVFPTTAGAAWGWAPPA